ncbi:MAG: haloacid dehalogenase-like hydrolase [Candidatus Hydrogenedentes bacterium]|nr:haloacid dehalogenase-like hydrolase [Candidatus Hydrogenedentota bacterium]
MSRQARIKMAICYDFDGTLSPGNMQEYDYIPQLNISSKEFWADVRQRAQSQKSDEILAYMALMIEKANADRSKGIQITRQAFSDYAKKVKLFKGVDDWFSRINNDGKEIGIAVEHYIISSGIREMIEGTSIAKHFERVYASSFMYDQHGVAYWPSLAVNYTTKTQFIFRINKGCLEEWDNSTINNYQPHAERPIPFERIVYLGDGLTDVPCMRLVKDQGGHSIAVYKPNTKGRKEAAQQLLKEGRVNFIAAGDYSENKEIHRQITSIIRKVAADAHLLAMATKCNPQPRYRRNNTCSSTPDNESQEHTREPED